MNIVTLFSLLTNIIAVLSYLASIAEALSFGYSLSLWLCQGFHASWTTLEFNTLQLSLEKWLSPLNTPIQQAKPVKAKCTKVMWNNY